MSRIISKYDPGVPLQGGGEGATWDSGGGWAVPVNGNFGGGGGISGDGLDSFYDPRNTGGRGGPFATGDAGGGASSSVSSMSGVDPAPTPSAGVPKSPATNPASTSATPPPGSNGGISAQNVVDFLGSPGTTDGPPPQIVGVITKGPSANNSNVTVTEGQFSNPVTTAPNGDTAYWGEYQTNDGTQIHDYTSVTVQAAPAENQNASGVSAQDFINFLGGVGNAWGSDNLLGAFRQEQPTRAGQLGAGIGHGLAMIQGTWEALLGIGAEGAGGLLDATGIGALAGIPLNVVGAGLIAQGAATAASGAGQLIMQASGLGPPSGSGTTAPNSGGNSPAPSQQPPQNVQSTLNYVDSTGTAPAGQVGGRQFINDSRGGGQALPTTDANGNPITYKEWDVNPKIPGVNRGPERLVTGSDGSAYYTADHYQTFTKIR